MAIWLRSVRALDTRFRGGPVVLLSVPTPAGAQLAQSLAVGCEGQLIGIRHPLRSHHRKREALGVAREMLL